ncbi:hypothetical protein LA080_004270 [Diaporthe eres]|nr:hypothetical protein LA080_004270 [Diaporthe eres]
MASPVALTPSFHPFPRLPYELRLTIIEEHLKGLGHRKLSPGNSCPCALGSGIITAFNKREPPRSLARYATINKQWKSVVEKHTFNTLHLKVAGLNDRNVLDHLEWICVGDRIDKISEINLSIVVNLISRYSGSATKLMNAFSDQGSRANTDDDNQPHIVHAERVATAALGHFFRIVAGWARDKEPLIFRCTFTYEAPGTPTISRPLNVPRLAIDSSSFPEVLCLGTLLMLESDYYGTQPESMFQLLTKLPNAKRSGLAFDVNLTSSDIKTVQGEYPGVFELPDITTLTILQKEVQLLAS